MPPKIVTISMVKDESDIIEAFVRHTLVFASHMVILDDRSTDGTLEILKALRQEGLPLTIVETSDFGWRQSSLMTRLMSEHAIGIHHADWVLPLDADEFVATADGESLIGTDTPATSPLALPWRNYLPCQTDDATETNPALRIRHRVKEDYEGNAGTILIPAEFASLPDAVILVGNHNLEVGGKHCELKPHGRAYLGHFQIRSRGQFLSKNIISKLQKNTVLTSDPMVVNHTRVQFSALKRNPGQFEERFLEAAHRWLEAYNEEQPEIVEDPFPYRGGKLMLQHMITDSQGWLTVLNYAEDLSMRYGLALNALESQGKTIAENELNAVLILRDRLEKCTDGLLEKEKAIQDQHRQLLEKEAVIQDQHRQLQEKEQVIQHQHRRLADSRNTCTGGVLKKAYTRFSRLIRRFCFKTDK